MARRVQELAAFVEEGYGGKAERHLDGGGPTPTTSRRIGELPGFGEMKIKALGSVLAKRFGVEAAEGLVPNHPTLGDVDSAEALADYQAAKRAYKAALKAAKVTVRRAGRADPYLGAAHQARRRCPPAFLASAAPPRAARWRRARVASADNPWNKRVDSLPVASNSP